MPVAYKKGSVEAMKNRQPLPPKPPVDPDLNDGKDWSEEDTADLKAAWEHGGDLKEISQFLCRADWQAVAAKCAELGLDLKWQAQRRTNVLARKNKNQ
jgi:hypothetical protein